jgi:hypothetical protein
MIAVLTGAGAVTLSVRVTRRRSVRLSAGH